MKWVTATDLNNWATTVGARYALSELVSSLVRATARNQAAFRFPTGDSAQLPGYDGLLEAEECLPYIPGGLSVWEFGTSEDARAKANKDYRKRTESPGAIRPEATAFVFVTPRSFPESRQWEQGRLSEGKWRGVKLIDGVALEDWLERCPAVALSFAQAIGKLPQAGVQDVAEFWAHYAGRTNPPLTEEVLLAGRSDQGRALLESLSSGTEQAVVIRADSRDEALAFALAVLRKAPQDLAEYLNSRTVVVEDTNTARLLAHSGHLILGLQSVSAQISSALLQGGNIVIVPQGNDASRQRATLTLSRPTRYEFAEALTTMGLDQERAERLARECGRSVTVLQRRIAAIDYPDPDWVRDGNAQQILIPALLAGSWDAKSDADRKILERLSRLAYEDFDRGLRAYVNIESPPIECIGNVWTLVAPVDSFALLVRFAVQQDLELLRAAAIEVFSEIDPRLDMPPKERPYAAIHGKTMKHSTWLREGMAGTLLLISVLGEHLDFLAAAGAQAYVNELIAALPELQNNYRLLASLEAQLPLLMEAAPDPLLNALEHLLEGDGQAIAGIFQESDLLWPSSIHTHLLWALEVLAWDPGYLNRVTLILGKLARLDPGGRLLSRPINSLRAIYLPWLPSTNAPLVARMRTLDRLIAAEPEVGWKLLVGLLPKHSDMADHPVHTPRWREFGASEKEVLTQVILESSYDAIVSRAIDSLGFDAERWKAILNDMGQFTEDERARVYEELLEFARHAPAEHKAVVWEELRTLLREHRRFSSATWALPAQDLDRLGQVLEELTPEDLVQQSLWLFEQYHPDVPIEEGEDDFEAANRFRAQALARIISAEGSQGVLRLARKSRFPAMVGATAGAILETGPLDDLLDQAWLEDQKLKEFATGLAARASSIRGAEWVRHVVSRATGEQWEPERIVAVLLGFSDERATWNIVESFSFEVERMYWERRNDWPRNTSREDLEFVAVKYAELGRAMQALDTLFDRIKSLSSRSLIALLDKALVEVNAREELPQSFGWLRDTFKELSRRNDIDFMDLARREYQWLPLLEHHGDVAALHKLLQESPEFFVEAICDVYRAHSEPKRDEEISEVKRARAQNSYRLLRSWKSLPGSQAGEILESGVLREWILKVRSLAAELDRATVADIHIGQLLAYAPSDTADGAWPHRIIRDVLEELDAPDIEQGIRTEQFNKRGASRKAVFEGGDQERALASQVRSWAAICSAWPRTRKLLEAIADSWERMAKGEDDRAELDKGR
ncbi:MAG: hypothetical protein ABUT39_22890 [Acidobacteriota bacterium]